MKRYVRSTPVSEKYELILKLSALCVVAFAQFSQKSEKNLMTLWIMSTKNFFLTA